MGSVMAVEKSPGLGFLLQTSQEEKAEDWGGAEGNYGSPASPPLSQPRPHPILGNTQGPHRSSDSLEVCVLGGRDIWGVCVCV